MLVQDGASVGLGSHYGDNREPYLGVFPSKLDSPSLDAQGRELPVHDTSTRPVALRSDFTTNRHVGEVYLVLATSDRHAQPLAHATLLAPDNSGHRLS